MWMPTVVRRAIFRSFFENGVLVVSSDQSGMNQELGCLNIYPYQIGRSFVSKGLAKKQYAWSHAYYVLTDKGIEYLRNYFGLPATAQPATLQPRDKSALLGGEREGRSYGRNREGRVPRRFGDRRHEKTEEANQAPVQE